MTNYIEEMMKTAGCKQQYCGWLDMGDLDTQYEYVRCDTLEEWEEECCFSRTSYSWDDDSKDWKTPELEYPAFTAEKQLEIIKLISVVRSFEYLGNNLDYSMYADGLSLIDALAKLTTELMKAGALDKSKVKEILEDAR